MNSGELDLKTRRNVSLAPADAGADRIAPLAPSAPTPPAATKPTEPQASETTRVSRIQRARKVLIVSIRCAMRVVALRPAREMLPAVKREVSRAISGQAGYSVPAPARPADGRAQRRAHQPRQRAPAFPSWIAARAPSTASAACPRGRILQRTPSLPPASSCAPPAHSVPPPAAARHAPPPAAAPCAYLSRYTRTPPP